MKALRSSAASTAACLVRRLNAMSRACDLPLLLVPPTFGERWRDRQLMEQVRAVDRLDRRSCPGDAARLQWPGKDVACRVETKNARK